MHLHHKPCWEGLIVSLIVEAGKAFKGFETVGRGLWIFISLLNLEIPSGIMCYVIAAYITEQMH